MSSQDPYPRINRIDPKSEIIFHDRSGSEIAIEYSGHVPDQKSKIKFKGDMYRVRDIYLDLKYDVYIVRAHPEGTQI